MFLVSALKRELGLYQEAIFSSSEASIIFIFSTPVPCLIFPAQGAPWKIIAFFLLLFEGAVEQVEPKKKKEKRKKAHPVLVPISAAGTGADR